MKRARGFTLMELGVVMAIMAILLVGMTVTTTRFYSNAKAERVSREIDGLLLASTTALKSNTTVAVPPLPAKPIYTYTFGSGAGSTVTLNETSPVCWDLSLGGGGACNGAGGVTWTSADFPFPRRIVASAAPPAQSNPILVMYGGRRQNDGFNPFCISYVICMYAHRVDVATCVPEGDTRSGGLSRFDECGKCTLAGEPAKCVFGSRNANGSAASTRLSYDDALLGWNPNYLP